MVLPAETLYATQARALYEREGVSDRGRVRLYNWAEWGDRPDRWPLDRRGKMTLDRIVQKYGEQARIGLFMNTIIYTNPTAREMVTRILRQWMDYCRDHLGGRERIPRKDVRYLLRSVIKEVCSFVRQSLVEGTTPDGERA